MIGIVDYGLGNIFSIKSALNKIGYESKIISSATEIKETKKIILPGVGAFPDAVKKLKDRNLFEIIKKKASDTPTLGICVGMQLLFSSSTEFGGAEGLDIISGEVVEIFSGEKESNYHKIPHIGWAPIKMSEEDLKTNLLLKKLKQGDEVYFAHSFHAVPDEEDNIIIECDYGVPIVGAVCSGHVFGTQFHPEKSSSVGLQILENFCSL